MVGYHDQRRYRKGNESRLLKMPAMNITYDFEFKTYTLAEETTVQSVKSG